MLTDINSIHPIPELWGGMECTINRVGDRFRDQFDHTAHYTRPGDIEKIAELGIRKLRYPILWERHQKKITDDVDWQWTSQQLDKIRNAGMEPIAGLLHHGSGPAFTDLEDEQFPELFAGYASKVAKQFPWLKYYIPVNEPLTTARFSGLYGHWYPHKKSDRSFARMLINQVKAVVLAMRAIREINPSAKLVQTEDLSRVDSTTLLNYQAHFENQRRWLTWDLLCGKIDRSHTMWNYFMDAGIAGEQLDFFIENPCCPDIIGCNYYVTSERWLDENIQQYPEHTHGNNGKHIYTDTEAVRHGKHKGLAHLLRECGIRYGLPIAITECHLGCSREEQLRWLHECWQTCKELQQDGVDIRAVTAWSLLGAYDWQSLLTREDLKYETGAFDISSNHELRPTALANMIRTLASGEEFTHPLVKTKGWWNQGAAAELPTTDSTPLLIIGKSGTLASAFQRVCRQRNITYVALGRQDIDITDRQAVHRMLAQHEPWAVINTAGYVSVDEAETNQQECYRLNTIAPAIIAELCNAHGVLFMTFSSDLVFNGTKHTPYYETDGVGSLNVYGDSKVMGEHKIRRVNQDALIVRSSSFFGPWDKYNFVFQVVNSIKNKEQVRAANDIVMAPTYVPDLVNRALDLFIDGEKGLWHITNDGRMSWFELAELIGKHMDQRIGITGVPASGMDWKARRPAYSVLASEKAGKLPSLENALERYFQEQTIE